MANSVTIRTSAPGAKQAAGEIKEVKEALEETGTAGIKVGALVGGGLALATKAASTLGGEYRDAMDNIRVGTGKTGEALGHLEQSFKNVGGRVEHDLGLVSQVLADLNTRTGLTGRALEDMTEKVIDFSDVTRTDAVENVAALTRVFGDWSVATEDQVGTMDQLLRASQATGIGMDDLLKTVVQYGAPMRALGLSFEEAIALLGKWEKEGVNTETMLAGLRMAVANFAKAGIDPREGLPALVKEIQALDDAQGLLRAKQIVGQRAANDFFRAVREGRFDVDDLTDAIMNGSDTVDQAAKDTAKFADGLGQLKNQVKLAIGPIVQDFAGLSDELGNAIFLMPALGGVVGGLTTKLWAKHKALLANTEAASSYKSTLGGAGAAAGLFAAGVMIANEAGNAMEEQYNRAAEAVRNLTEATPEQIAALRESGRVAIERADALKFMGFWDTEASVALRTLGQDALDAANRLDEADVLVNGVGKGMASLRDSIAAVTDETVGAIDETVAALGRIPPVWRDVSDGTAAGARQTVDAIARIPPAWKQLEADTRAATRGVVDAVEELPKDVAGALRDGKGFVADAMDDLMFVINNPIKRQRQIAKIEGALMGENLAAGLASADPAVRTQALETQRILVERWEILTGKAYTHGGEVGDSFKDGVDDAPNPEVPGLDGVEAAKEAARRIGGQIGRALTSGFNPNLTVPRPTAGRGTPPQRRQHGGPVSAGEAYVVGETQAELFVPSQSGKILPSVPQGSGTSVNVHIHGNIYGGRQGLRDLYRDIQDAVRQGVRGTSPVVV